MAARYPGLAPDGGETGVGTTDATNATPNTHAAMHDAVAEEVVAIGTDLVSARGASSTLAAKIAAMDAADASATAALAGKENTANKGVASGYAPLDANALVPTANLPAGAPKQEVFVAAYNAPASVKARADYVCTGTNDEVTIQAAIDAAGSFTGPIAPDTYNSVDALRTVRLSAGVFKVGALNAINLAGTSSNLRRMSLVGSGHISSLAGTTRIIGPSSGGTAGNAVVRAEWTGDGSSSSGRGGGYRIANLAISGADNTNAVALKMKYVNVWTISDVALYSARYYGMEIHGASDATLERMRFEYCGTYSTAGAGLGASARAALHICDNLASWATDNLRVRDCTWETGMDRHVTIQLSPGSQAPYKIAFSDCKFEATVTNGGAANAIIMATAGDGVSFDRCYFFQGTPLGAVLATTVGNQPGAFVSVSGNYNVAIRNSFFSTTSAVADAPGCAKGFAFSGTNEGVICTGNMFEGGNKLGTNSITWAGVQNRVYSSHNWEQSSASAIESSTATTFTAVPAAFKANVVASVVAGTNITVDNTDPNNPVIASTAGGGAPSGAAGGDLSGTYPNPTLANTATARTNLGLGGAATLSVGTAAGTVAAGNDSRFTNSRTPTGAAGGDLTGTYPNPTLTTSGVSAGTYGSSSQVPTVTVDAKGRVTAASATNVLIPQYGGLVTLGDSYTQIGGGGDSSVTYPPDTFTNFTHRLAAIYRIPTDEVYLLGKSGGAASSPSNATDAEAVGVGQVLQYIFPNHVYTNTQTPVSTSQPFAGLFLFKFGYNDLSRGGTDATGAAEFLAHGTNTVKHGFRTMISRVKASSFYAYDNAALTYGGSGAWATNSRPYYASKSTSKRNGTSGGTLTFTIPVDVPQGSTVSVCLIAGDNGYTTANGAGSASTSLTVVNRSVFPASGNFDILIGGVAATVTAGHGTGAGTFTLSAAKTWSNGAIVERATAGVINWSGTASAATGSTTIAGQGRTGRVIQIVKRFALSSTDAGKTIIGTSASLGSNEYFEVDSVWIEGPSGPTVAILNQPYGPFGVGAATSHTKTQIDALNTAIASVTGEFAAPVTLVDMNTSFAGLFGATLTNSITNVQTSFDITLTSSTLSVINVGSVLRTDVENMLVTGISGTGSTRTVTVTRNYTGTYLGAVSHTSGIPINDIRWIRTADQVHPSDYGHQYFAAYTVDAISAVAQTSPQVANSGGYVARNSPTLRDGYWLTAPGARTTFGSAVQDSVYAVPFYVPGLCVATAMGCEVVTSAGGASSVTRLGIYANGEGRPGALVLDAGTVATATTGVKSITGLYAPLRPGWYWLVVSAQVHATTPTFRSINTLNSIYSIPNTSAPSGSAPTTTGVSATGVTGALPYQFPTTGEAQVVNCPISWVQLSAPQRDGG